MRQSNRSIEVELTSERSYIPESEDSRLDIVSTQEVLDHILLIRPYPVTKPPTDLETDDTELDGPLQANVKLFDRSRIYSCISFSRCPLVYLSSR